MSRGTTHRLAAAVVLAAALSGGAAAAALLPSAKPAPLPVATVVAAGDIARCEGGEQETARLVGSVRATVLTLGDLAYPSGAPSDFARCYAPSWGRFRSRTRPTPGNHEYRTPGAGGYFSYFAGVRPWYAFDLATWRAYSLNSECCLAEQVRWLRRDLAARRRRCVLAYWHRPRFSSGRHGSDSDLAPLWEVLYAHGADIVLNGHDHDYERFRLLDPSGRHDPGRGIRQFVVGTGGAGHYRLPERSKREPTSAVGNDDTYGVLRLVLRPGAYRWDFLTVAGRSFSDRGRGSCV